MSGNASGGSANGAAGQALSGDNSRASVVIAGAPRRSLEFTVRLLPFRLSTLLLALALPAGANTCPPGQTQVCLYGCLCVPEYAEVQEQALELAAINLRSWIVQSREQLLAAGTAPIPPAIRQRLLSWYSAELLDRVRYRVGGGEQLDAASALLHNPDIRAVTLIDLIVFREAEAAERDVALWAHELHHVQQYQTWGVEGFARRYAEDFDAVEGPAYDLQLRVSRALRQQTDY